MRVRTTDIAGQSPRANLWRSATQEYPIMFSKISVFPVALMALGASQLASASNYDEGQWVTTFMAGSDLVAQGSFNPQIARSVAGLGTTTVDHLQYRDAFKAGPAFGIETGFMSQSNVEPFVRLSYSQMQGRTTSIGIITSPALDSQTRVSANFGDLDSWALDLGTRYFLTDTGAVRTYVAGYLGADRLDPLHARLAIGDVPGSVSEEFLPRETRFNAGVEGGVAWQLSDQAGLTLSVGAQYLDARRAQTAAFAPVGIEEVSFTEPRWSIPVDLGVNFRF
jgi:hypothetical protein